MDRPEQELNIIEQISQILGGGLELSEVFQRAMTLLERELSIEKAALALLDPAAGQLRIVASIGYTPEEQRRGRYDVGEGVSGHVLEKGQPEVIPDVAKHKAFLNRTQTADVNPDAEQPHSYICIPVFDGVSPVGTIGALKRFTDDTTLKADARLLKIIAGLIAQTIRIHQQIRLERDHWLEERQQLTDDLRKRYTFDNIIGSSPAMLDVL
ncbi:MAG: GAF domain-containing protein, partial [Planctomycetota bacterium]